MRRGGRALTAVVSELGRDEVEGLRGLVSGYPYLFDGQYAGEVPQAALAETYLKRTIEQLDRGSRRVLAWCNTGEISGLASIERLDWDSRHFGVSMARLELVVASGLEALAARELILTALRLCSELGIRHVSCRLHLGVQNALEALTDCRFRAVGVKLSLRATTVGIKSAQAVPGVRLRDFRAQDAARVRELAGLAVIDSRFHRDGRFDPGPVRSLYENWVERTWKRESGQITVAEQGGEVVAFLAADTEIPVYGLRREDLGGLQTGFVGLVAVDVPARGSGIGKLLIGECTGKLFCKGCSVVYANVMLTNESSVNAFFRIGFGLKGSVRELHLWL